MLKLKKDKTRQITIRIPEKELKELKALAKKYAEGNLSRWLIVSGLRYIPKRGEK